LEKKEVRTYERRRRLFTLVKAASYDKIYAIASKGSAKQERTAAFEEVRKVKDLRRIGRKWSFSKYFKKTNKEAVRNVT
jgi:polyribonucleotide nucleotidyltransferase